MRNVPSKTKVIVTLPRDSPAALEQSLTVDGVSVPVSLHATHLGVVRSSGNLSNHQAILERISAHTRALGSVMSLGLAKNHRVPLTVSLHIQSLYAAPVLFSGLAPLLFSKA